MSEHQKVWGLMALQPTQEAQVKAHCFGDCGKISMAGVVTDNRTGGFFICCEETCPYMEMESGLYGTTVFHHERGDTVYDVYVRILRKDGVQQ